MHRRSTFRLRALHRRLDHEIETEQGRLRPDRFRIVRLKKLKLALKDRLALRHAPPVPA